MWVDKYFQRKDTADEKKMTIYDLNIDSRYNENEPAFYGAINYTFLFDG